MQQENQPPRDPRRRAWRERTYVSDLSPTERHVALVVAEVMDRRGLCYLSVARIAFRTGYSRSTVQRALRQLVKKHFIRAVGRTEYGRIIYSLVLTEDAADQQPPAQRRPGDATRGLASDSGGLTTTHAVAEEEEKKNQSSVAARISASLETSNTRDRLPADPIAGFATDDAVKARELARLLALLPNRHKDDNTPMTFSRIAQDLSANDITNVIEEVMAGVGNHAGDDDPIRDPTRYACAILKRQRRDVQRRIDKRAGGSPSSSPRRRR